MTSYRIIGGGRFGPAKERPKNRKIYFIVLLHYYPSTSTLRHHIDGSTTTNTAATPFYLYYEAKFP